jgi:thiol-disulfide isomerase/thioredoxin
MKFIYTSNSCDSSFISIIRRILPKKILGLLRQWRNRKLLKNYIGLTNSEIFTKIYKEKVWGGGDEDFYSGGGSHDSEIVKVYISELTNFISKFPNKPDVVDLGCGDFAVGSKIRHLCAKFVACDVVEPLILRNQKKFRDHDVDFLVKDIVYDDLPDGDIALLRQVLQHLSNREIGALLPKLQKKYKYLVLTEHLPSGSDFTPNLDKPVGPDIRLAIVEGGSGVVLTEPPFNLVPKSTLEVCSIPEGHSVINTVIYEI